MGRTRWGLIVVALGCTASPAPSRPGACGLETALCHRHGECCANRCLDPDPDGGLFGTFGGFCDCLRDREPCEADAQCCEGRVCLGNVCQCAPLAYACGPGLAGCCPGLVCGRGLCRVP